MSARWCQITTISISRSRNPFYKGLLYILTLNWCSLVISPECTGRTELNSDVRQKTPSHWTLHDVLTASREQLASTKTTTDSLLRRSLLQNKRLQYTSENAQRWIKTFVFVFCAHEYEYYEKEILNSCCYRAMQRTARHCYGKSSVRLSVRDVEVSWSLSHTLEYFENNLMAD